MSWFFDHLSFLGRLRPSVRDMVIRQHLKQSKLLWFQPIHHKAEGYKHCAPSLFRKTHSVWSYSRLRLFFCLSFSFWGCFMFVIQFTLLSVLISLSSIPIYPPSPPHPSMLFSFWESRTSVLKIIHNNCLSTVPFMSIFVSHQLLTFWTVASYLSNDFCNKFHTLVLHSHLRAASCPLICLSSKLYYQLG